MKKGISLALLLLLVITAMVGCGSEATNEQEPTNVEQEASNMKPDATGAATEKGNEEPAEEIVYKDGVYEGVGEGLHTIKVSVEVTDGKIAKVNITEHEETDSIADPALEQIPAAIVESNSPNVDVVSGATMASEGIIEAVNNALKAAK